MKWEESYKCGCIGRLDRKADATGYCPTHGDGRVDLVSYDPADDPSDEQDHRAAEGQP